MVRSLRSASLALTRPQLNAFGDILYQKSNLQFSYIFMLCKNCHSEITKNVCSLGFSKIKCIVAKYKLGLFM